MRSGITRRIAIVLVLASVTIVAQALCSEPITCVLRFPEPHTHYVQVELHIRGLASDSLDLKMPVWIPGSYLIREFERNVERFEAYDPAKRPLPWRKVNKNTWRVTGIRGKSVTVQYWVYAFDRNVRASYVDAERAFINPSSVVMFIPGQTERPYRLRLELPPRWKVVSTGLERIEGEAFEYLASDYDELVDCPLEIGNHTVVRFQVDSVPHEIAVSGYGPLDPDSLVAGVRPLIETAKEIFGEFPYKRYVFLVHLSSFGGGGLEHRNSCALMVDRFALDPKTGMHGFLSLVAHEFFHTWNVKAIRPKPLGPFDYDRENYTTLLWLAEGFTTYYAGQIKLRAGLISPQSYLNGLARQIADYEVNPGREVQSLAMASFDAWIKYYRRDENFINSGRSYYSDGALFATVLDLEIRHRTKGRKSLDDVMRLLYNEYAKRDRWVTFEDFVQVCNRVADADLRALFRYVTTTDPMDFATALSWAGLEIQDRGTRHHEAYLGVGTRDDNGKLIVTEVRRGSPAYEAGVYARDEIVAVDSYRVSAANFPQVLSHYEPGDTVQVLVSTDGIIRNLSVTLRRNPRRNLAIVKTESPTDLQKRVYEGWLHTSWDAP